MREDEIYDEEQHITDDSLMVGAAILTKPLRALKLRLPITVAPSLSVRDAVRRMVDNGVGCVLIEDGDRLVGIFTERDVLTKVVCRIDPEQTPVSAVMTPDPETLRPEDLIAYALNKMSIGGFRHIPLIDERGRAVGAVAMRDIVDFVVDLFPSVLNLPPQPELSISRTREGA
jgi:CBS domain-containing protein